MLAHLRILIFLFTVTTMLPAMAQIALPDSGSGASESPQVDADRAADLAVRSFRAHTKDTIEERVVRENGLSAEAFSGIDRQILTAFEESVREAIMELQGDGLLETKEVSDRLSELRSTFERELSVALSAIGAGYEPPPVKREFNSEDAYLEALASYTFQQRNQPLDWLWMLLIVAAGIFTAWLVNFWLSRSVSTLSARKHVRQSELVSTLKGPLYLAAIGIGLYWGLKWIWIPGLASEYVDQTLRVILSVAGFWVLWNAADLAGSVAASLFQRTYNVEVDRHTEMIIVRVLKIATVILASLVLVKVILDTGFTGMLAGLGIVGLALYLILKGALENLAASFTIFGDKPIRVGDVMIYDDKVGTVENIGFRSTGFRILDGDMLTIPNSVLIDDTIHNVSARPSIRRRFRLGLPYDTSKDKIDEAISILEDILSDYEGRPEDQPAHVVFEEFGAYDLQLMIEYFVEPPDYWQVKRISSEINLHILQRFNDADIDFAFPTQTTLLSTREQPPEVYLSSGHKPLDLQVLDRASESDESSRSKPSENDDATNRDDNQQSRKNDSERKPD